MMPHSLYHLACVAVILSVAPVALAADPAVTAATTVKTTPKLEILNKQIQENAENAQAYSNRGYVLALLGRKEEARADLKKALELKQDARMRNRVGWALFNLGDYAEAVAQFEESSKLSGFQAHYDYYSLVLGHWGTGDTRKALENYQAAVEKDPRFGDFKTLHERTLEWTPLEQRAIHEIYVLWSKTWKP